MTVWVFPCESFEAIVPMSTEAPMLVEWCANCRFHKGVHVGDGPLPDGVVDPRRAVYFSGISDLGS